VRRRPITLLPSTGLSMSGIVRWDLSLAEISKDT
jgi:hypothetical protein